MPTTDRPAPRRVIARYTVKPGFEEVNEALVRDVYAELAERRPAGFRYATFRVGGGRDFVHVASIEPGAQAPLTGLAAFRAFQAGLAERCEHGPTVLDATQVGAYGAVGGDG